MEKIELHERYYLDHFREMMKTLESSHHFLLDPVHHEFLKKFKALSEEAQCLYIRMTNRKGVLFDKKSFAFSCWDELFRMEFARPAESADLEVFLGWIKKDQLLSILEKNHIPFKKSHSKTKLLETLNLHAEKVSSWSEELEPLVVNSAYGVLHYMLFVLFGKVQDNLILYTLRDLGIRKSKAEKNLRPKFSTIEEARSLYFYSTLRDIPTEWPEAVGDEAFLRRERCLLKASEEKTEEALYFLKLTSTHPASEKLARLLYEQGLKEECRAHLHKLLDYPTSDEELLFAEDFLARKFGSQRQSLLTATLRSAETLEIDDSFYRHPEFGVVDHHKKQGRTAHFSENDLWSALFGIIFHEQLALIPRHSEFDRVPKDLKGKVQMVELRNLNWDHLLEIDHSEAELFRFDEGIKRMVKDFISVAPTDSLAHMLEYLAEDFWGRRTGFPDLFVIEAGKIRFIEVKAEGDSLKRSQLLQMRELEKAGFSVEVLNVRYRYNPEQVYVVVDIETTGHLSPYNRITEIAAVKIKGGVVLERFQSLINPKRPIPRDIQALTGITDRMVAQSPVFAEVSESFLEFSKDAIFVAHNVQFDYGFIQKEFERLEQRFVRPYICTKAGMKKHYPKLESYGLKNLSAHFSIPLHQHHRAMSDAEAAAGLLNLINEKRSELRAQS